MATGQKRGKKRGNVVEIDPDNPVQDDASPGDSPEPAAEAETKPSKAKPSAPAEEPPRTRRNSTFFDRVRKIQRADWGSRAFIYVYCLEPICNLKMGGETKYLVKLKEPLLDEDSIMIDYGSGKYRLQLVQRKPGGNQTDQTDVAEIEIYNPKYPPKIPQNVWMNDPRNERWAALLPKEEPPAAPPTPLGSVTEAFKTFGEMQREMKKDLTPPAISEANKPQDPLDIAQKILTLQNGAGNPMVALFQTQMQMFQAQAESARVREAELQKELRDQLREQQKQNRENAGGNTIETLIDKADTLIPKLKSLFGFAGEQATQVIHGPRVKFWEQAGLKLIEQAGPLIQGLAARAIMPAPVTAAPMLPANGNGNPQLPTSTGQPAQPSAMNVTAQRLMNYLTINILPMQRHFEDYLHAKQEDGRPLDGSDFAYWIWENHGEQPLKDARTLGAGNLIALFKATPFWPAIQQHEQKLVEFLDQVLRFEPPEPEQSSEGSESNETDLTAAPAPQGAATWTE